MALTSPDDIWTPDSGDDYALTTDLATMADTIQSALTKKANYGVGTTAQMNAALGEFPNGALWYNTTTSSEWRRVGGSWVNQDTGWVDIELRSGFSWTSTAERGQVRRIGGVVYTKGVLNNTNIPVDTTLTVADVPAGFRPEVSVVTVAGMSSGGLAPVLRFNFSGGMDIRSSSSGSKYYGFGGISWPAA